jgi:hypothetical protein
MSFRNVGGMGEAALEQWAHEVGIIPNRVQVDKGGWDFFLQWPSVHNRSTRPTSLDHLPSSISCIVQVKATDTGASPDIELSNWARLCNLPFPAFILFLKFARKKSPKEVYLIHVGEKWISQTLSRLRELPQRLASKLHKHTMRLTWEGTDKINPPSGAALKARIEELVGPNPATYVARKTKWREESGYEEGRFHATLLLNAGTDTYAEDRLVNFALGMTEELPVTLDKLQETRFGISKSVKPTLPREISLKIPALRPTGHPILTFAKKTGEHIARISSDFFDPRSVFPFLAPERLRFRFKTRLADFIVVTSEARRIQIRPRTPELDVPVKLEEVGNLADLMIALRREARSQGSGLRLSVHISDKETIHVDLSPPKLGNAAPEDIALEQAASDAWRIGRIVGLSPDTPVTMRELQAFGSHSSSCRTLLDPAGEAFTLQGNAPQDAPENIELGCR